MMVLPDKATKSFRERPLVLNRLIRVARVEVGGGIAPMTSEKRAVLESLLPNFTFQLGPPNFKN